MMAKHCWPLTRARPRLQPLTSRHVTGPNQALTLLNLCYLEKTVKSKHKMKSRLTLPLSSSKMYILL